MKKRLLLKLFFIINLLIAGTAYSNDCLRYIENHQFQFFLTLGNCRIQDNDLPFILSYLSKNPHVSVLFLDENNIGPEGAKLLASKLRVSFLGMDDNHVGPLGAEALSKNKSLTGLSLTNNYIENSGALALANATHLINLTVAHNNIQPDGIIALARNPSIRHLNIAKNTLDATSKAALINNTNLVSLDVSYTNADFNDISALLNHSHLESISINGLNLGDKITKVLVQNKTLNYIDITDNNLTAEGAIQLANFIHADFIDLNISHNPIGDKGIAALAKTNSSLLPFLSVEDANITDEGARQLANTATYIIDLNISHNHLTASGIEALQKSSQISYFDASYNDSFQYVAKLKSYVHSFCKNGLNHDCLISVRKMMRVK